VFVARQTQRSVPPCGGGVERGERNIGVDDMERIAADLRVPLADLLK
jgi:hypothetical protein